MLKQKMEFFLILTVQENMHHFLKQILLLKTDFHFSPQKSSIPIASTIKI